MRLGVAAGALLVFTNGPVLLFSKSVLDRSGRWEDPAVWPFLAAAGVGGAALAASGGAESLQRLRPAAARLAAAAVGLFTLAALASSLWSVEPSSTAWRSTVYIGMALLAWFLAGLDPDDTAGVLGAVAGAAVGASVVLVILRPDLGLDSNNDWKGVFTNRNSLAPVAAIGLLVSVRRLLQRGAAPRLLGAALAAASTASLVGAGSRTAWFALVTAAAAATVVASHRWMRLRWGPRRARTAMAASLGMLAVAAAAVLAAVWDVATLSQRRTIWELVWDRILERPLFGYGFYAFWDVDELTNHVLLRRGSAHNSLMEAGLGLGLLGAVPFLVIAVLALRNAGLQLWRSPGADTWVWAAVVAFALMENVTESFLLWFSYNWVLIMAASLRPAVHADYHRAGGAAGLEADGVVDTADHPGVRSGHR